MNKNKIFPLTPNILSPNDDAYKAVEELRAAIDLAFQNKQIKNIALTGPYGSGKSTILNTLIHEKSKTIHPLSLSLATLKTEYVDIENGRSSEVEVRSSGDGSEAAGHQSSIEQDDAINRKIEYSILQQLVYREKDTTVPNSRLRRIKHISGKEQRSFALLLCAFVIAFFVLFEPSWAKVETFYEVFNFGCWNIFFDAVSLIYILILLYHIAKTLLTSYSSSKLNKLNLKDGEIEMKEETSIFNKHLDEILYFFQVTDYNVVIIEDVDRFGTPTIFLKLRELNFLLNESKIVDRHIVFLYAVKDDIFKDEERTKFFDYITTVIPVINPSNSKDKLLNALIERGIPQNEIADDDLAEMAFFIQDMRLLKNIANEFVQYRNQLCKGNQSLNSTLLLGMIVYKNYYPNDFAKLHRREGKIYNCINSKPLFVKEALKYIEGKKQELQNLINLRDEQNHIKEKELRKLFLLSISTDINNRCIGFYVNNCEYHFDELANSDDAFHSFVATNAITYTYYYGYSTDRKSHSTTVADYDKKFGFSKRLQALSSQFSNQISQKKAEIKKLELSIRGCKIQALLNTFKIGNTDEYKKYGLSPLMDVFIRRGYINEEYYDYISYFYEGMLTTSDRDLLLSMKRGICKEYTYSINKVQNFIKELREYMFEDDAILNNDLVDYLSIRKADFFELIMRRIYDGDKGLEFLAQYYTEGKAVDKVFKAYVSNDKIKNWDKILDYENVAERANLIEAWLKYCGKIDNHEETWLEKNFSFLDEHSNSIGNKRCKDICLESCFTSLSGSNKWLIQYVIDNVAYVLNIENIQFILSFLLNMETSKCEPNYSLCATCDNEKFIKDIQDNLQEALELMVSSEGHLRENEESILFILNNSSVDTEVKRKYLRGQENMLEDFSLVKEEYVDTVVELYLVKPTWENVVSYFNRSHEINVNLCNYIKHFKSELTNSIVEESKDTSDLLKQIVISDSFSNEDIQGLSKSFAASIVFSDIDFTKIEDKRLNILQSQHRLAFTSSNTEGLKDSQIYSEYLLYYYKDVIGNINSDYLTTPEVSRSLLQKIGNTDEDKVAILKCMPENHFYSTPQMANIVLSVLNTNAVNVVDVELRIKILKIATNTEAKVIQVTQLIKENSDTDLIKDLLHTLQGSYSAIADQTSRPKFPINRYTHDLLDVLTECGFISSYKLEENKNYRVYPKQKK